MSETTVILTKIEEQQTAYAALQDAIKKENKEAQDKALEHYNQAKKQADAAFALQEANKAQLEKIEADVAQLAATGGGGKNGGSKYNEAQTKYRDEFAKSLRNQTMPGPMNKMAIEAFAEMVEKDASKGGFFVFPELSGRIIEMVPKNNPMRGLAAIENISGNTLEILADPEGIEAEWYDETETIKDTKTGKIYKHDIPVHGLRAKIKISRDLAMDARYDIESRLIRKAGTAFANAERAANISGNGVKKPTGLFTVDKAADASNLQYGKAGFLKSGAAAGIGTNIDPLLDLISALPSVYRPNARFMANAATFNSFKKLKATSSLEGYLLWSPSFTPGEPDRLLGYSAVENEACPDIAADKFPLVFGDIYEAYTIVDRQTMYVVIDYISDDSFIVYKFYWRVGGSWVNTQAFKFLKIAS
jgi:HK97 family phage major capsid protein